MLLAHPFMRQWREGRLRLRITRVGWWYLSFTLVVGFAGVNTGNNLLFLLFGLLLAGVLISGVLSQWTLRGLSVERVLPSEATAGKAVLVGLRITNRKKRIGSYAIVARDVTRDGPVGQAFSIVVDAGQTRELTYRWEPPKRGLVQFVEVDLVTRFPFALFEKWLEWSAPREAVVFPREIPAPPLRPRQDVALGEQPNASAGPGTEFFALRDHRIGDDARSIHWLTSARRGRPVVVERERERRRRLSVLVDNRRESLQDQASGIKPEEALDQIVEAAAAIIRRADHEGCEVACSAAGGEMIAAGAGPVHLKRILKMLALLEPIDGGEPPAVAPASDRLDVRWGSIGAAATDGHAAAGDQAVPAVRAT
jgi:uncharacterized protein (DUF58 family)